MARQMRFHLSSHLMQRAVCTSRATIGKNEPLEGKGHVCGVINHRIVHSATPGQPQRARTRVGPAGNALERDIDLR